jgi:hypothetical protein
LKFAFRDLRDAVGFYETVEGSHIARALYLGDGREKMVYYVDRPERYTGDPDTGMDTYRKAQKYESFIDGSVECPAEEWTYLPGFGVVVRRGVDS